MIKIDWRRAIRDEKFLGFYYYTEVSRHDDLLGSEHIAWSWDCFLKRARFEDAIIIYKLKRI